ncbi:hypothetical protein VTL71DRAFT_9924 [Oculimacula yallundae]|uniref:Uncharacterized protein n=1 Tax=Oculimacula yallundae TaxID=86028 RepID=A0ABR4BQY0_9HELO
MTSYKSHGQTAKSRGTKVKPILRKLTQSEKNSLDLDRSAAEQGQAHLPGQDGLGIEYNYGSSGTFNGTGFQSGSQSGSGSGPGPGASRSSHDVQMRRGYHYHHRSTSGTSQFSIATTGSGQGHGQGQGQGHRTGSFVHPFQQTPRPYTPPIVGAPSYQNSFRESELDHSPALTEDEDQLHLQLRSPSQTQIHPFRSPSNISNHTSPPSITGVSSSPNISQSHPLRIQTNKQASFSRLAPASSHTSLHNTILSSEIASPTDTMSPASAIRSSLDKGFRIRSRSEVDSRVRTETIQEARRKFQEKEEAKEEKAAREEIKALEKRQMKEARQIERGHRRSSASNETRSKRSKSDLTSPMQEKDVFVGRDYNSVAQQQTPTFAGVGGGEEFYQPRRSGTAKLKTHSAWTKFVMWLRTRFIRMGKKN